MAPDLPSSDHCVKHGPHAPGECPKCDELAEARSIVATTYIPPAPQSSKTVTKLSDQRLEEIRRWLHDETDLDPNASQDELASIATELQLVRKSLPIATDMRRRIEEYRSDD